MTPSQDESSSPGAPRLVADVTRALTSLSLYLRTVSRLRPAQWLYLPLRRIQSRLGTRLGDAGDVHRAPDSPICALDALGPDLPDEILPRAERTLCREFDFLNHTEKLAAIDWRQRYVSHLWNYNLHYFDYARTLAWAYRQTGEDRYATAFVDLARSWIRGTEPGRGDGWQPYTVSLRTVNWIRALALLGDAVEAHARREIESSLSAQVHWLERRMEYHVQANHLQKNYAALATAGFWFAGTAATRWRKAGLKGSWAAILDQVLPDGGHFERSPMYHAIALGDFLDLMALCSAAQEPIPPEVSRRVERMAHALTVLSRPDGTLHLFNDSANGIAPGRAHLERTAVAVLGRPLLAPKGGVALTETGYWGWINDDAGDRILIDCGEAGPSFQPGHAHCDMLHFELDLGGVPLAVDAGVHGYAGDPYREYVRSTRAHNTVVIAGREQHEVWGAYRMARRGRVLHACQEVEPAFRFEGACSPFHDAGAAHHRLITRDGSAWRIRDRVAGAAGRELRSYLHLHPEWELEPAGALMEARRGDTRVAIRPICADAVLTFRGATQPLQGWHCPEFGLALPAWTLEFRVEENDGRQFGYDIQPVV